MMISKYADFLESASELRMRTKPPLSKVWMTDIICPFCEKILTIETALVERNKASKCGQHLKRCRSPRKPIGTEKPETVKEMREEILKLRREVHELVEMREKDLEAFGRISQALGIPPPPPANVEELEVAIFENGKKRKRFACDALPGIRDAIRELYGIPVFRRAFEMLKHDEKAQTGEQAIASRMMRDLINDATQRERI